MRRSKVIRTLGAVELDERNPLALWALGFASLWARRGRSDQRDPEESRTIRTRPGSHSGTTLHYWPVRGIAQML